MIVEYRSDTGKVTGSTGEVQVVSLGQPVPNMRETDKAIETDVLIGDILDGALPVPVVTFAQMVADVQAFGGQYPNITVEQKQEWDALVYLNQHPELMEPFTVSVTAPDGTFSVVGADVRLDGEPAVRYGYVACAEPFTWAQWDVADGAEDNERIGPHGRKHADD